MMCGICGFNWRDEQLMERMKDAIRHRGPDDHGSYFAEGVSLGHRRLSIIDLSAKGRQPMSNETGTVWVVCNGEIYNYRDLRKLLEGKGHVFCSNSDTEVIVYAYEEFGADFLNRLIGMFGLGVYDTSNRRFMLARDRLSIKPIYYYYKNGRFLFALEMKSILCEGGLSKKINPQALLDLVGYEFVPAPNTLFKDIHKLTPGCLLVIEDGGEPKILRYWDLEEKEIHASGEAFLDLLGRVCAQHLMSEVPLGAFLSGGIDSSTVVHLLTPAIDTRLKTFSLGYQESSYSEFEFAKRVSDHYRTEQHELIIRPVDLEVIKQSIWHLDEPNTDPFNLPFMLICEQAGKHVKVCLSGDGRDEILMGYDRFRASKASYIMDQVPIPFRRTVYRAIIYLLPDDNQKKGFRNILKRFLQGPVMPPEGEHIRWQYFLDPGWHEKLFETDFLSQVDTDPFCPIRMLAKDAPSDRGRREQFFELQTILPDSVLMKVDKMSMAFGLEIRPPFLDHRVVEVCYSLPTAMKLRGFKTKWLLKHSLQDLLPPGIAHRKKQGFSFPMKNWMLGKLKDLFWSELSGSSFLAEYFNMQYLFRIWQEHQRKEHNDSHVLWNLVNLSLWAKLFLTDQPALD